MSINQDNIDLTARIGAMCQSCRSRPAVKLIVLKSGRRQHRCAVCISRKNPKKIKDQRLG